MQDKDNKKADVQASEKLGVTITGLKLANPTMLAAGVLGSSGASLVRVAKAGTGAVITKSIGIEPKEGHHNPSMVELECGYINAMGLPNPGYSNFAKELQVAKNGCGALIPSVPVIASIFGASPEEFVTIAEGLKVADAFELNVSCPHASGFGASVGTDPVLVGEIVRAMKKHIHVPVWVKLTPNVTDIVEVGLAAQKSGADAVCAINTVRAMAIDIETGYPILGNRFGGMSGPAIKPVAIKCVYDLYQYLDIPIIGVGGISTWRDAVEMMMAGASAVQIGSAAADIEVFSRVPSGIGNFIEKKNMRISEIVGLAHRMG